MWAVFCSQAKVEMPLSKARHLHHHIHHLPWDSSVSHIRKSEACGLFTRVAPTVDAGTKCMLGIWWLPAQLSKIRPLLKSWISVIDIYATWDGHFIQSISWVFSQCLFSQWMTEVRFKHTSEPVLIVSLSRVAVESINLPLCSDPNRNFFPSDRRNEYFKHISYFMSLLHNVFTHGPVAFFYV